MASNTGNEGKCLEQILLQSLQKECGSADALISDSDPQNRERIYFHCSKAPRLRFVTAALGEECTCTISVQNKSGEAETHREDSM